jgi:hypothetical protein
LIVGILLFILYNIYVDTRNWSNTGSFIEGMDNNEEKVPEKGTFISNEGRKWEDQKPFKVSENIYVFGGKDGGWFKMASVDSNGNFIENRYTNECATIEELTIEIWNSAKKGGDYKVEDIVLVSVEPQKSSEQQTDSNGAGSAETAMNNEISSRAGNVAPMGSNVPQNCKTGCIAPTGPNGNCKVIQKDGVEKRECYYGCPNPTFERGDTVNCAYDKDCNSCGTVLFNPDAQPNMPGERPGGSCPPGQDCDPKKGHPAGGNKNFNPNDPNSWVGDRIDVPGIQNAPGLNPGEQTVTPGQQQMVQGQMNQPVTQGQQQMVQGQMNQSGSTPTTVSTSNNSLFNENIMKQVLEKKDLIPGNINPNNDEQSFNLRIGQNFMINTATIRNFALPNIENQDYIELGRIVKKIKMREKDPRDIDQVKALYSKLNVFVLELLTDSSLDMSSYDNSGMPNQLNNKTRTTGMFGENSNSLLKKSDTYKEPGSFRQCRGRIKCYDSIWGLN